MAWELASGDTNFGTHLGSVFMGKPNWYKLPNGYIALAADYEHAGTSDQPFYLGPLMCFYNISTGDLITPTYFINSPDNARFESLDYFESGGNLIAVSTFKTINFSHKFTFFWYNFGTGEFGQRALSLGGVFADYTGNVLGVFGRHLFYVHPAAQSYSGDRTIPWYNYRIFTVDLQEALLNEGSITPTLRYSVFNVIRPFSSSTTGVIQRAGRLSDGRGVCYSPWGDSAPNPGTPQQSPRTYTNYLTILQPDGSVNVLSSDSRWVVRPDSGMGIGEWYDGGYVPWGNPDFILTPRVTMVDPSNDANTLTIFSAKGVAERGISTIVCKRISSSDSSSLYIDIRNTEEAIRGGRGPGFAVGRFYFGGDPGGPYGTSFSWTGSLQQSVQDGWVDSKVILYPRLEPLLPAEEYTVNEDNELNIDFREYYREIPKHGGAYGALEFQFDKPGAPSFLPIGPLSSYYEWVSGVFEGVPLALDSDLEGNYLRYYPVGGGQLASAWGVATLGRKFIIDGGVMPFDGLSTEIDGPFADINFFDPIGVFGDVFKYGDDYYMVYTERYLGTGVSGGYGTQIYRFTESNRESIGYII